MNLKFNNRGITLIALVVTIIVLLILAGISISMLTGQNGILNRANEAKSSTEVAQTEETLQVSVMEAMSQGLGKIMADNLKTALNNNVGAGKYEFSEENEICTVKIGEKSWDISTSGQIQKSLPSSPKGLEADTPIKNPATYGNNAQATADGAGKYFAKPDGAKYEEGTVDTGVVVTIKGSQFVWVPVDDVVLDTSKVANLPTDSSNGISNKKTYTPMAVQVGNDYKGILYEFSGSNGYLKYGSNTNYQGSSSQYREPDVVSYDQGSYSAKGITLDKLTKEYNAMIASVLKYKGFYVARYEAGIQDGKVVFKNANTTSGVTTLDASSSSANMWYGLYEKMASFAETNDKYVSSMIWGSQYDAMMNWMAKTGKEVGTANSTKTNTDKNMVTGSSTDDVINNVYDLYGCHCEWTLEASYTDGRVGRGGYCIVSDSPAIRYGNYPRTTTSDYSSRATLYIK